MTVDWPTLLERLAEPFPQDAVQWRVGAVSRDKKRAQALPYAEPRVYEDVLNRVVPGDWSCTFIPWGENRIICELTIHGVTRSSTGEENDGGFAPGTAAEAQAFKRSCSKFGLGRYLYDIGIDWLDYDDEKKRLVKNPRLSAQFLPKNQRPDSDLIATPLLNSDRAEAMAKELEKLGFNRKEQLKHAAAVLVRPVVAFTQLTEAEALEVWQSAKRLSKSAA